MARCFVEPNHTVEKVIYRHFEPLMERFDAVLMRIMPDLTRDDVFWRIHLLFGALHQSMIFLTRKPPGGRKLSMDAETYIQGFVTFAAAGFRAALPPQSATSSTP
jgi:hypothetical protein